MTTKQTTAREQVFAAADEFMAAWLGKGLDLDYRIVNGKQLGYGTQCVDLDQGWWRYKLRKLVDNLDAWLVTGNGTALGLWIKMVGILNPSRGVFVRIPHATRRYQKGDMLVWNNRLKPLSLGRFIDIPTGHTAMFVKYINATTIQVFQQDGDIDKDGDGNADGVAHLKNWGLDSGILGAYRLKIADDGYDIPPAIAPTPQTATKYYTTHTIPEETRIMINTPMTTIWDVNFPTDKWDLG